MIDWKQLTTCIELNLLLIVNHKSTGNHYQLFLITHRSAAICRFTFKSTNLRKFRCWARSLMIWFFLRKKCVLFTVDWLSVSTRIKEAMNQHERKRRNQGEEKQFFSWQIEQNKVLSLLAKKKCWKIVKFPLIFRARRRSTIWNLWRKFSANKTRNRSGVLWRKIWIHSSQ